jgi:hypothetical protein
MQRPVEEAPKPLALLIPAGQAVWHRAEAQVRVQLGKHVLELPALVVDV